MAARASFTRSAVIGIRKMQMEGCLMMGLGYTLSEEVRLDGGRILTANFDTYELPRRRGAP
jgi:CO/xanthine dehydrogenase Mo-binding subunit